MQYENEKGFCIFLDIDGTILQTFNSHSAQILRTPELLPGALEFSDKMNSIGNKIIITTGREESARQITDQQLQSLGICYDQLIMSCGNCPRTLINDHKLHHNWPTCFGITIPRNAGLQNIDLDRAQYKQYLMEQVWEKDGQEFFENRLGLEHRP